MKIGSDLSLTMTTENMSINLHSALTAFVLSFNIFNQQLDGKINNDYVS